MIWLKSSCFKRSWFLSARSTINTSQSGGVSPSKAREERTRFKSNLNKIGKHETLVELSESLELTFHVLSIHVKMEYSCTLAFQYVAAFFSRSLVLGLPGLLTDWSRIARERNLSILAVKR